MSVRRLNLWPLPSTWRILVADTRPELDEQIAAVFLARVRDTSAPRVVLASGATFAGFFKLLRTRVDAGGLDLSGVRFTHLDEFRGVAPFSPGSLSAEIRAALFPDGDPRRGSFAPLDATASDADVRHESAAAAADLTLVGIGANGHLAFNEPGASFAGRTHFSKLTESTRAGHVAAFAGREVPAEAVTAGLATILSSREILAAASGVSKTRSVADMLNGALSPAGPASALRLHDRVTLILDRDAAAAIDASVVGCNRSSAVLLDRVALRTVGPILVVAPHPDDASISAGGLLASLPGGAKKTIATFSTGARADGPWKSHEEAEDVREKEAAAEASDLGAEVRFLRAKAYMSGVLEAADVAALEALIGETKPEVVCAPARLDPHPTHRLCRLTVEEALRGYVRSGAKPVDLWTFEGPWRLLPHDEIGAIVRLDAEARAAKLKAMARHASQMARVPFDRAAEALAVLRAAAFSESHLGGKKLGGFDPESRIEAFAVETVARVV